MTIAIIPARAGSKGLKNKNIAPLRGRPLIEYTLEAAADCLDIDTIVLTSDSEAILKICPYHRWLRKKQLGDDDTPVAPVCLQGR